MTGKIVFCLLIFISYSVCAEKTKQALRALKKGDYQKVEEIVHKSLAKDSLNPASNYIMALMFSMDSFPAYDIDMAHNYILRAVDYLYPLHEDYLHEFEKADLDTGQIAVRKMHIDSLAFARAKNVHSVRGYNYFLDLYTDASQFSQGLVARNQLIFKDIRKLNTWQAYKQFIDQYPNARQVDLARESYEKLLFREKTSSGKMKDLISFLDSHPNTPYRRQIEQDIFDQSLTYFDEHEIVWFISKYKNEQLTKKALSLLYHADFVKASDLQSLYAQHEAFFDSATSAGAHNEIPLIPILDKKRYSFLEVNGKLVPALNFEMVSPEYFCGNVLVEILQVAFEGSSHLVNRVGDVILSGDIGRVSDLGNGLLAVAQNSKVGIVHKSGYRMIPPDFEEILLLGGKILAVKEKGKIGLMGINGEWIVQPKFDAFYAEGKYWIYQIEDWFGVTKLEEIIGGRRDFPARYEEIELVNEDYLIAYDGDYEVLINDQLEEVIPGGSKRINTRFDTWVIQLDSGYKVFDTKKNHLSETTYDDLLQNSEWLCLKRRGKWSVYNKDIYDEPIIGIDSVKLIGDDLAMVFRGDQGMAIFPNKQVVAFIKREKLQSIGSNNQTGAHFLVIKRDGKNILYKNGIKLLETEYEEIGYISDSAFYVKHHGKYGAIGLQGQLIMRVRYDAIARAENEIAPVLFEGKFGAYNFTDRILMNLEYDEKISQYNAQYFKVKLGDKYGILDRFNVEIITPIFDEIEYWTDTSALVRENEEWQIINIKNQEKYLTEILDYEYIKDEPSGKIIRIRTQSGFGIYHSKKGLLISPTFSDIINLGNVETPLYYAEKSIPEADYYVVVYYDADGEKIRSAAYTAEEYEQIVCDR